MIVSSETLRNTRLVSRTAKATKPIPNKTLEVESKGVQAEGGVHGQLDVGCG